LAGIIGGPEFVTAILRGAIRRPFPSLGSQRRDASIGRIDNQGGAPVRRNPAAFAPEFVVGAVHVGGAVAIAPVAIHAVQLLLFEFRRFGCRRERLRFIFLGPFHGCPACNEHDQP
jgi:hypothetical protein